MQDNLGCDLPHDTKCLGFSKNGSFGAGFACHDMRYDNHTKQCISVAFSLVIKNPQIMNKKMIFEFFHYPFNILKVHRLWALIDIDNKNSNMFAQKIGAIHEGVARQVLVNGHDANVWSITRNDLNNNKWWQKWVAKAEQK